MGLGFAGAVVVAGLSFYAVKQNIAEKRKAALDGDRLASQALGHMDSSQEPNRRPNSKPS